MLRRMVLVAVLVRLGMMLLIILGSSLVVRASALPSPNTATAHVSESSPSLSSRPGLNETAELVVRGTVERIVSQLRNGTIWSRAEVSVYLVEKGVAVSRVVVEYKGGEVGDIGQAFSDQPRFKVGELVLLYLTRSEGDAFVVVGGPAGKVLLDSTGHTVQQQAGSGYSYTGYHWASSKIPVGYYVNTAGGPAGALSGVQAGFLAWNGAGAMFSFQYLGTTTQQYDFDGYNTVSWGYIDGPGHILAEAVFWYYRPSMELSECDILFDSSDTWATDGSATKYDVQNIAAHESGHWLVLLDLYDSQYSEMTMYGYVSLGETKKRTLEWGDIAGILFIYGPSGPPSSAPSLVSPSDGTTVTTTTPTLSWSAVSGASFYMPEVWQGGTLVWRDWPSTTSFTVPSGMLSAGLTYQWRAYAANSAGYGPASVFRSFTVAGAGPPSGAPIQVSPSDGATVSTTTPTLWWGTVAGASFYMPEVWQGGTLIWRDWPGGTSMTVPSGRLSAGATYQWRVYAANGQGYGPASGFWTFTVAGGGPPSSAPSLVSPIDGATVYTTTPTLSWSSVSGATFYMPEIWQGGTLVWRDWPATTSFTVPSGKLSAGVTYQWQVYAANPLGYGPASASRSFTVAGAGPPSSAPVLVSPADTSTVPTTTPTLCWTGVSGASFYMPEVWQGGTLVWRDWPAATCVPVPSGLLNVGQSYQWRVYAGNSQGYGPASGFWTFTVAGGGPPSTPPTLVSPSDGATVSSTTPTLQWNAVSGATFYMVEVWQDGTLVWRDWPGATSMRIPSGFLTAGQSYQWRVYAANSAGYGPPSVFRTFSVAA